MGGGSSLPAWGGVALHHVHPVPSTRPLAKIPGRLEKALAFPALTCLPQGSHSHPGSSPQPWCQGLQGSRGEQPAACRKLHPFLKHLQHWIQSSEHHPCWHCAERSNSFLTQQRSGMGTPLTAVLKLVHAAQFSQFFHCVIQRHVVFPSAQVNFSLSFFFSFLFLEVLIPKT